MMAEISAIAASPERPDRWIVEISRFARINLPEIWQHWRNPVRYAHLSDLGVDPDTLRFEPMRDMKVTPAKPQSSAVGWPPATLTIPEAKKALAATFGVKPDAVEITVRG